MFTNTYNLFHEIASFVSGWADSHDDLMSLEPWGALEASPSSFRNRCSIRCRPWSRSTMNEAACLDLWRIKIKNKKIWMRKLGLWNEMLFVIQPVLTFSTTLTFMLISWAVFTFYPTMFAVHPLHSPPACWYPWANV